MTLSTEEGDDEKAEPDEVQAEKIQSADTEMLAPGAIQKATGLEEPLMARAAVAPPAKRRRIQCHTVVRTEER